MILQIRQHVIWICFVSFLCNGILKKDAEAYENAEILRGNIIDNEDSGVCPSKNSKFPVYLPHPSDCSKFYICDSGSPHLKQCHPGLHFNPKINTCDFPENVKCNTEKPKGKLIENEDSDLCPSKNSEFPVYLPHPVNCSKFYICDSGSPHLKDCLPGLHFNPKINACDFPENTKCRTDDVKNPNGEIIDDEDSSLCPAKNSKFPTYLPHPSDCSKFYICDSGSPHLKQCHPGLHFNPKINACDFPENVKCNTGNLEKPKGKLVEDEDSGGCPTKNSKFPVYLPHPSDCSKFYICDSGSPHLKQCHRGLHFNPKIKACDYPTNAKCSLGDLVKPKGEIIGDEDSSLCPAKNSKFPTYLPHPSDCSKFYICDSGSPHLKQCNTGLHFNPKINACDFPENVKCNTGNLEKPKGKLMDDEDSGVCPAKNSKFLVYLSHPSDCSKFYICDSGSPHLKQCFPGLHFNPKIKACDYPENVKCNDGAMRSSPGIPSPHCPPRNGKIPIFFRDSANCSVYYMCGNGLAYPFVCPARLHFNLRKRICDYENAAGCTPS